MSFFGSILSKLGFGDKPADATPPKTGNDPIIPQSQPVIATSVAPPPAEIEMSPVDIVSMLDGLAEANAQTLNWKTSIVDLLKLLNLDSSLDTRKALAVELDCPPEKMGDSAAMNTWLHQTVLQKLADNGGNVPQELL